METQKIIGHLVNTQTEEWFHYDDRYRLWNCTCKTKDAGFGLCLSICDCLKDEGELAEVKHQIARRRKELSLLYTDNIEEIIKKHKDAETT